MSNNPKREAERYNFMRAIAQTSISVMARFQPDTKGFFREYEKIMKSAIDENITEDMRAVLLEDYNSLLDKVKYDLSKPKGERRVNVTIIDKPGNVTAVEFGKKN